MVHGTNIGKAPYSRVQGAGGREFRAGEISNVE